MAANLKTKNKQYCIGLLLETLYKDEQIKNELLEA